MPSRTPSNASSRPRRSKSFSSTRPQQLKHAKSFNTSEPAHHEALTAAELAFQRAEERHTMENGCECNGTARTTHPAFPFESPRLAKRQSVRFTGSNAIKTRELPHTRRVVLENQNDPDQRQKDRRPEYAETIISSEPSSYRKLRKSKSMFAPGKSPSVVSAHGTHKSRAHFKHDSMRSLDDHNDPPSLPDRRLRRSFSFLRGVTDRLSTADRHHATNDAAIQMARDQYLCQLEQQRVKEQPFTLNFVGRRKSPKDFRRTVRTSSINSYNTATQCPPRSAEPAKAKSIGRKARTVSQTLKWALKKVFRRPLPNELKLPEQHLSATRAHYGERLDDDDGEPRFSPIPSPDVELLRRVDSRESIFRNPTGYNESKASNASILSANTEDESSNQQSRVTSWTDSTKANTINMPQFVERKRLSIIKEDGGPHQPSSPAGLYMDSINGYAAFRQPVRLDTAGPAAAQRVYSALQREIRKSEQIVAWDEGDLRSDSGPEQLHSVISPHDTLQRTSSDHIVMDGQPAVGLQPRAIPMSRSILLDSSPTINGENTSSRPGQRSYGLREYDHEYVEVMDRLTPQQVAHLNEPEIPAPRKPLRKVKSAFFPSEFQVEKRTMGPYRQAAHDSNELTSYIPDKEKGKKFDTWISPSHSLAPMRNSSAATSESVYSRTEGGHSPRVVGSSMSLPKSESSAEIGTAVIITSGLQSSQHSLPASSQRPPISNEPSSEWKKHMASEVSFFEDHRSEGEGICNLLLGKESGHKRENAQWDVEEVTIGNSCKPITSNIHPFGRAQTGANARPALQERMSRSNIEGIPFQDVKTIAKEETITQKENIPKRRFQKSLDKQSTVEAVNRFSTSPITTFDGPRSTASQLTINPRTEKKNSPASVNSRSSPERAERLRRLQNRSSQSLPKPSTSPNIGSNSIENEIARTPPAGSPYMPNGIEQSISRPDSQGAGSKALVNGFLRSRRSQMRISDDSGGDPAFL